ncbi:hypothetical protein EJ05DRAFT_505666 [Pseudovirgaria hyperparasitica]|uniref:Uncharacterized protein n=1 Tax=Pseudovirgaria hyperparasitica TaxID=470096 RepID=A0A6A6VU65_9PEZI|nr:uncharacterized protein EJ05DRAFT_505666 [Pseudovirgaria hyperparasitica]KAF2752787.1 hypothetical protein EJ05DRAFT_505666 [Pseudovirgaria hyperparasitica]
MLQLEARERLLRRLSGKGADTLGWTGCVGHVVRIVLGTGEDWAAGDQDWDESFFAAGQRVEKRKGQHTGMPVALKGTSTAAVGGSVEIRHLFLEKHRKYSVPFATFSLPSRSNQNFNSSLCCHQEKKHSQTIKQAICPQTRDLIPHEDCVSTDIERSPERRKQRLQTTKE